MKYIFLDESGELGFKERSSKYFIITLLSCDEGEIYTLRRIIKKVREKLIKKELKKYPEIKGNNSTDKIRIEVLERFTKTNAEVFVIILEKSKVYEYLKDKKNKLYNYISNLILNECSFDTSSVCLVVDKSKSNRSLRDDFDNYIKKTMNEKNHLNKFIIKHENSYNDGCLQVLDFVSWAIFRNYEFKDPRFIEIIKVKIVMKKEVFQKLSGP
ncbi:hypothetical protein COU57_05965 [Candidatus Pacearchaeota archaeon CG10_big_fil_rev_8_21_14_0_10_32_14]|nr:MAG: hypothetical protein COU57_05965 [Candidatus Pacearchaeota archaeon CG10_big_fil_rev_8_21_14_0_10_32_14]